MTNQEQQAPQQPKVALLFNGQFVQQLAEYLASKPYKESAAFIQGMQTGNVLDEPTIVLVGHVLNKQFDEAEKQLAAIKKSVPNLTDKPANDGPEKPSNVTKLAPKGTRKPKGE